VVGRQWSRATYGSGPRIAGGSVRTNSRRGNALSAAAPTMRCDRVKKGPTKQRRRKSTGLDKRIWLLAWSSYSLFSFLLLPSSFSPSCNVFPAVRGVNGLDRLLLGELGTGAEPAALCCSEDQEERAQTPGAPFLCHASVSGEAGRRSNLYSIKLASGISCKEVPRTRSSSTQGVEELSFDGGLRKR
jgi:hypothetical protein